MDKTVLPGQGGLGSILARGTRSHMLQLKPQGSQIKIFLKKEELLRLHLLEGQQEVVLVNCPSGFPRGVGWGGAGESQGRVRVGEGSAGCSLLGPLWLGWPPFKQRQGPGESTSVSSVPAVLLGELRGGRAPFQGSYCVGRRGLLVSDFRV